MSLLAISFLITTVTVAYLYSKLRVPLELSHIPSKYAFRWLSEILKFKPYESKLEEMMGNGGQYRESKVQVDWIGSYVIRVMSLETSKLVYNDTKTFPKVIPTLNHPDRLFSKFLGESIVFTNGKDWRKHRKAVNPSFKKGFQVNTFVDVTRKFFTILDRKGKDVLLLNDVYKHMQRITMDCLGKDILGVEFNSITDPEVEFLTCYNQAMLGSTNPIYFLFPSLDFESNPFRKPYFNQLHRLNQLFKDILAEKRKALERNDVDDSKLDLLSLLIKASKNGGGDGNGNDNGDDDGDGDNEGLTDLDIQNNITTFLLAGHDTTSFALTATLHLLAEHPQVQDLARSEVMRVMEYSYTELDSTEAKAPTLEQVKKMDYLLAIMKETMRLYPSLARLPDRYAAEDVELDGYFIPKGTSILLDTYCTHRDPDNFKDPNKFVPERFLGDQAKLTEAKGWFPFGGGSRLCIGLHFSLLEQKVVLAMILSRYKLINSNLKFHFRPILLPRASDLEFVPLSRV